MNDQEKQDLAEALQLARDNAKMLQRLNFFMEEYYKTNYPDKMVIFKELVVNGKFTITNALILIANLTLKDGGTLNLGATTGTKIGATGDKAGFLGATPLVRQGAITSPTAPSAAYVQAEAQSMKTAVDAIRTILSSFGFTN